MVGGIVGGMVGVWEGVTAGATGPRQSAPSDWDACATAKTSLKHHDDKTTRQPSAASLRPTERLRHGQSRPLPAPKRNFGIRRPASRQHPASIHHLQQPASLHLPSPLGHRIVYLRQTSERPPCPRLPALEPPVPVELHHVPRLCSTVRKGRRRAGLVEQWRPPCLLSGLTCRNSTLSLPSAIANSAHVGGSPWARGEPVRLLPCI